MSAVPSHFSSAPCSSAARVYRRRRPERTVLYRLVQQHLETWLARRRESDPDAAPIPRHVESELRRYLECGILAQLAAPPALAVATALLSAPRPAAARPVRAVPDLKAEAVSTPGFAFDQSLPWDPLMPPPDPGFSFDRTLV